MEQRQFDADSLIDAVVRAVSNEILPDLSRRLLSSGYHEEVHLDAQLRDFCPDDGFAREVTRRVAEEVAEEVVVEVVDRADYETSILLGLATQEVQERSSDHRRNICKANASPSWRQPPQRGRMDLSNTVITAWPTFDKVLVHVAQVVVKDRSKEIAATVAAGIAASATTVSGNPVVGTVVATILPAIASVVAEIVAQLATVAAGIEYVDPTMQCVYQRAMRLARYDPDMQVLVRQLVQSFSRAGSSGEFVCSSPYLEGVIKCPFRLTTAASDGGGEGLARCLLADVSGRFEVWKDDEGLEDKIRRMMRKLENQKVLGSRIDRHPDTFFRASRLVTGLDRIGGR